MFHLPTSVSQTPIANSPFPIPVGADDAVWEMIWATYDQATYQMVLQGIQPEDVVMEIGAGDLRLARRIASIARKVYAIEIQPALLAAGRNAKPCVSTGGGRLPDNLTVWLADARQMPIPEDVTCGVLLMRHCTCFRLYAERLKAAGASKLITNARWRMDVEIVDLRAGRIPYQNVDMGWYACWCGKTGFKPGPVEQLTPDLVNPTALEQIHQVSDCPVCKL